MSQKTQRGRNTRNNRGRGRNNQQPRISRNPSETIVTGWHTFTEKPKIAKNQTVYSSTQMITATRLPGLAKYMAQYQTFEVISLGARFNSAVTHSPGLVGIYVLTDEHFVKYSMPTTINHQFLRKNDVNIVQLIRRASSPPSNNTPGNRVLRSTDVSTDFGTVIWAWEGPSNAEDQTHMGEIEIFVNMKFSGVK